MPLLSSYLDRLGRNDRRMVKRLFAPVVVFYLVLAALILAGTTIKTKYLESPGASSQQHAAVQK
jgi:hypothetical protein